LAPHEHFFKTDPRLPQWCVSGMPSVMVLVGTIMQQ
jgi:hypothetical protein